jgi:hypothetical protein
VRAPKARPAMTRNMPATPNGCGSRCSSTDPLRTQWVRPVTRQGRGRGSRVARPVRLDVGARFVASAFSSSSTSAMCSRDQG